jgi:peptidoglycan-associated lipoprotein
MKVSQSVVLVAALAVSLTACGKKKVETPPPAAAPPPATTPTRPETPPPPPPAPATPAPAAPTEDEIFAKTTLEELNKQKPLADVLFAYDSVQISEEGRASLQKNLQWLKRWTSTRIMVEGHADSRGTNEYNLALAERRADAVRDYLTSLGLAADRITIVSKGEEQPFCGEESEACWQQNRRGHFIITAK